MKLSLLLSITLSAAASWALPADRPKPTHTPRAAISARWTVNEVLAYIADLFPVNMILADVTDVITDADEVLATLLGWDTSEDDLTKGSSCADVLIVFARGTAEPGDVGALVGPPFFEAAESQLKAVGKSLAVQGVDDYDASVEGFLEGGDPDGSQRMADLVTLAQTQCPSSKIVMSGYSQGGQIVHNAAGLLSTSVMNAISSVVIFGDPDNGTAIAGVSSDNTLIICHDGDNICEHGDLILLPHLTYLEDADTAAEFVVSQL